MLKDIKAIVEATNVKNVKKTNSKKGKTTTFTTTPKKEKVVKKVDSVVENTKAVELEYFHKTLDYAKYIRFNQNREIDKTHVNEIIESIKNFGDVKMDLTIIKTTSIDGTVRYVIGDGQHRREACLILGIPMNVTIIEMEVDTTLNIVKYISMLNNMSKGYSSEQYLKAYAELGIPEYVLIQQLKKDYTLTVTDFLHIFLGSANKPNNKLFKDGNLRFIDKKKSMKLLNSVIMIQNVIPKSFSRRSVYKVMKLVEDYNEFALYIIRESKGITFSENQHELLEQLTELFEQMKIENSSK